MTAWEHFPGGRICDDPSIIVPLVTKGMVAVLAVLEVLAVVPINVLSTSQLSAAAKHWSGT